MAVLGLQHHVSIDPGPNRPQNPKDPPKSASWDRCVWVASGSLEIRYLSAG